MKEKKGFTLIELLAVIVILAIIALIATPIVLNLISKARRGAAEDSGYGLRKAAQLYYTESLLKATSFSEITFKCDGTSCTQDPAPANGTAAVLDIDGTVPETGTIKIKSNGEIETANIKIGGFDCTIPNTGNVTCGGESSNGDNTSEPEKIITYGYSTASTGYKKDDSTTLSYTRPTSRNAYLKYTLINGIVDEEILPEACVYYETYGGELCLKYDDYNNSISKIKTFFKWDDEAKKTEYDYVTCSFNETSGSCQNPNIGANSGPNGRVGAGDYSAGGCSVESRTFLGCS